MSTLSQPNPTSLSQSRPGSKLTPQQQLEAIRRLQDQAEQRVKLGIQLFKAAEAHTTHQHQLLLDIKADLNRLLEHALNPDSPSASGPDPHFDLRLAQLEDQLTRRLDTLQANLNQSQARFTHVEQRIDLFMQQIEHLLARVLEPPPPPTPQAITPTPPQAQTPAPHATPQPDSLDPYFLDEDDPAAPSVTPSPNPPAAPSQSAAANPYLQALQHLRPKQPPRPSDK